MLVAPSVPSLCLSRSGVARPPLPRKAGHDGAGGAAPVPAGCASTVV